MYAYDRLVAGLRCSEVLQDLSAFFDGELPLERSRQIEQHVAGCDWCERFGGDFAHAITRLRQRLQTPPAVSSDMHERLMLRLAEESGGGGVR